MYNLENNNQANTSLPTTQLKKGDMQIPYKPSCTPFLFHFTLFPSGVTIILNFVNNPCIFLHCYTVFVNNSKHKLFGFVSLRISQRETNYIFLCEGLFLCRILYFIDFPMLILVAIIDIYCCIYHCRKNCSLSFLLLIATEIISSFFALTHYCMSLGTRVHLVYIRWFIGYFNA